MPTEYATVRGIVVVVVAGGIVVVVGVTVVVVVTGTVVVVVVSAIALVVAVPVTSTMTAKAASAYSGARCQWPRVARRRRELCRRRPDTMADLSRDFDDMVTVSLFASVVTPCSDCVHLDLPLLEKIQCCVRGRNETPKVTNGGAVDSGTK
jgi:multisubunit Na+/H+ antiporter MnhG subunit